MGLLGFLRLGVWLSGLRAFKSGFLGNVLGEGFVLGGVYVIGPGQQVRSSPPPPLPIFSDINLKRFCRLTDEVGLGSPL